MASASAERIFFAVQNWWLSVWSNSVVDQASKGLLAAARESVMDGHPLCMLEYWPGWQMELELKSDGWLVVSPLFLCACQQQCCTTQPLKLTATL